MSDHLQTPFPTESSRSQVFVLKTTRPATSGGKLSPVPGIGRSKPTTKRTYMRKKGIRHSASSRNLKENSSYSRTGAGLDDGVVNLRTKLRARRTTSFASLKDQRKGGKSDGAGLSKLKTPSQVSLASPFCSRPASPDHGAEPPHALAAKRALATGESGDMESCHPVRKRRSSTMLGAILPSPIPFRPSHSPPLERTSKKLSIDASDLHRRPSHPALGMEFLAEGANDRGFILRSFPVNFNRPPSQLSIYAPLDGDDDDESVGQRTLSMATDDHWVYNERFEAELQDASTPYKRDPGLQRVSLELLSSSPQEILTGSNIEAHQSPAPGDRSLEMSLTSVEDDHLTDADLANRSPWISDSLISPPTVYLRQQHAHRGHGHDTSSLVDAERSSVTLRTLDERELKGTHGDLDANVSKEAYRGPAVSRDVIPADASGPRQTFGRTRSGTIVATAPTVSSALRNRSGTITAAPPVVKQGRGRSGTITQSSAVELKPVVPAGRSRSGTVTSARPQVNTCPIASLVPISDSGLSGSEALEDLLPAPESDVHIDALFDPTAGEDLVFSSAPNPDIEAESDDEVALCRQPRILSPVRSPSARLTLSSPTDPMNLKAGESLDRAWADVETDANGKKPFAKRSVSKKPDPKGHRKLNLKSLGFNSTRRGRKCAAGETRNEPGPECEESLSSDPIDFLQDFDQEAFNQPYEKPGRKTSRSRKVKFTASRL